MLLIIAFFLLGISRDSQWLQYITEKRQRSLGFTRYSDHASRKHHGNVLKAFKFLSEINKDLMHTTSPDLSHRFSTTKKCFTALY